VVDPASDLTSGVRRGRARITTSEEARREEARRESPAARAAGSAMTGASTARWPFAPGTRSRRFDGSVVLVALVALVALVDSLSACA
jgi:hypothetical protein